MENMQNPMPVSKPEKIGEPLNKNLALICGTIVVVCLIVVGALLYSRSTPSNSGNNIGNNNVVPPSAVAVDISKVKTEGDPFIGNANAPVVIAFWSDYQCPFCKKAVEEAMSNVITDYVNTGKAKIVFKDWAFLGADSQTLGLWARAVWEAAPGKFGAWHKAMFDNQGTENTGWATQEKIMSITTNAIGASDASKASEFVGLNSAKYQKAMDADKTEGTSFGINGTPGTIIGKQLIVGAQPYSAFKAAIDQVLAGK